MSWWSKSWKKVKKVTADIATGGEYSAKKLAKEERRKQEKLQKEQEKEALRKRKAQVDAIRASLSSDGRSTRGGNRYGIKEDEERLG